MSERHLGVKLIGKVDVVEEILSQIVRKQAISKGTLAATLFADKHRSGFVAMKHIHLQPVGDSRTEPGGAPSQLFACQPRNPAKEFSHMVLTIPFRQVLEIFPDRIKLRNQSVVVIRSYDGSTSAPLGSRPVALTRDDNYVYIDGVRIEVEQIAEGDSQQLPFAEVSDSGRDYSAEIETLADSIADMERGIAENIFIDDADRNEIKAYIASLRKEIAFTRQDIEKLYD